MAFESRVQYFRSLTPLCRRYWSLKWDAVNNKSLAFGLLDDIKYIGMNAEFKLLAPEEQKAMSEFSAWLRSVYGPGHMRLHFMRPFVKKWMKNAVVQLMSLQFFVTFFALLFRLIAK